jgi:phage terminase small subunit
MANLTPNQERFVQEYLVDLNGTQAAIRAGYAAGSASVTASRLLANAKIAEAIAAGQGAREKRTGVTADRVVAELAKMAFVDLAAAYDDNGNLLKPSDMPADVKAALAGVDFAKTGDRIARFAAKERALELLGKHLGMFRDKVEHSGPDGAALSIVIDLGAGK